MFKFPSLNHITDRSYLLDIEDHMFYVQSLIFVQELLREQIQQSVTEIVPETEGLKNVITFRMHPIMLLLFFTGESWWRTSINLTRSSPGKSEEHLNRKIDCCSCSHVTQTRKISSGNIYGLRCMSDRGFCLLWRTRRGVGGVYGILTPA